MSSMTLEQTPIWPEVKAIIESKKKPVKFEYRVLLHTEKEDITVLKLITIDNIKDYVNNICDHLRIEFKLGLGDYIYRLYPYKTNLEATIKIIRLDETTHNRIVNTVIAVEKYKMILPPGENPDFTSTPMESNKIQELNNMNILDIKAQLVDRSAEVVRIKTTSGIFRQCTTKKLLHSLLAGEIKNIKVDGKHPIDGIDFPEPDNKEQVQQIIVPDGTTLSSLPTYMQEKGGGIYSNGMGTYIQSFNKKKMWFIYPLFDFNRFSEDIPKLIFYFVPQNRLGGIDRTYQTEGNTTHILITSAKNFKTDGETDLLNGGTGFRMSDARSFMKKPITMTEEGPVANRTRLNHEVAIKSKDDGLNFAPMIKSNSLNTFANYSDVGIRNVDRIDFVWENSDITLLYPGMPCKCVFLHNNKLIELKASLAYVHNLTALQSQGITSNLYKNQTGITVLTEKLSNKVEPSKQEIAGVF